jgi:hypothetical protein
MYSKQEASRIRKNFWTSFGQYMKPLPNAEGEPVNWLNYKTGIKHIFFRMDADNERASIAIELTHPDPQQREELYMQFLQLKSLLTETVGEEWEWQKEVADEHGKYISRMGTEINGVNIFKTDDWPAIISFLKPRMIALDKFWVLVKNVFL